MRQTPDTMSLTPTYPLRINSHPSAKSLFIMRNCPKAFVRHIPLCMYDHNISEGPNTQS